MNGSKQFWQFNLYKAMRDPSLIAYEDELVVIIKDKYPKSEEHFLVLPQATIPEIRSLNASHLPLLRHMDQVSRSFCANFNHVFWAGFHAKPTMMQLHLHLISDDFRGSGLKTAKHWNSYTTSFFVSISRVIHDLETHGRVLLPSNASLNELLRAPLQCHKCLFKPSNMATLKVHLISHTPTD
ncbi:aprataxin-like [Macrosteles quadrilineatus]|uniref:aprataxin-like n=1 Tax=Macrosteles quadrilineatus TaxID=74068 RepID=UPI0023E0BB47|nr:aprataxin-like [Macrosteles quadrilineatus]